LLSPEPGLLRPFQIGFHLLNQVPVRCAETVANFLSTKNLSSRLQRVAWISAELDHLLPGTVFVRKVKEKRFDELKTDVQSLNLILDHVSIHCLEQLMVPFPLFPRIIGMQPPPIHLDRSVRFVQSLKDLEVVHDFVSNLVIDI
jgi:hypothetical protein